VIAAYLFGSHARESAHRESDVDAGVVLDYGAHATRASRFEARIRLSDLFSAAAGWLAPRCDPNFTGLQAAPYGSVRWVRRVPVTLSW
jgi:hypothetical protein